MRQTDAIVIGAGQAGLAMSRCLGDLGIAHTVLDRGRVAERWRSERWDSLRLLTPNWMSRLPGWSYRGSDPDGYMAAAEVLGYLDGYARASAAPVLEGADVRSVRRVPFGYRVETSGRGAWEARVVVVATGHCDVPLVPTVARQLPASVRQITPSEYRNPDSVPKGGVLVVGASATGVQLAEELQRAGRPVTLAVGRHTRLPRMYRGQDVMWWMDRIGVLGEAAEGVRNLRRARAQPSLQLVGHPDRRTIDLGALHGIGVRVVGRVAGVEGAAVHLRDDLPETMAAAQGTLERLLARIDLMADAGGAPSEPWPAPFAGFPPAPATLDLRAEGIRTVLWATGFRRDYAWLHVPAVLDPEGELIHCGGVTSSPGLYALGLRFMRRRNSTFLDGVGADAADIAADVLCHLDAPGRLAA